MRPSRLFLLSLCVIVPCSLAQPPAWLHGNETARKAGLRTLGFSTEISYLYGAKDPSGIQWFTLHGTQAGALIFLPCGAMQSGSVGLLRQHNGQWSLAAQTDADCHFQGRGAPRRVFLEVLPLLPRGPDMLLLHNDGRGHGTAYSEQHMEIFEIAEDSFVKRFDTLEYLFSDAGPKRLEEDRRFLPHRHPNGPLSFQDTCIVTSLTHGAPKTRKDTFRREIRWSAATHHFQATPFRPLGASKGTCEPAESDIL